MSRDSADRLRDILDCIRKARNADRLLQQGDQAGDRELVEMSSGPEARLLVSKATARPDYTRLDLGLRRRTGRHGFAAPEL